MLKTTTRPEIHAVGLLTTNADEKASNPNIAAFHAKHGGLIAISILLLTWRLPKEYPTIQNL